MRRLSAIGRESALSGSSAPLVGDADFEEEFVVSRIVRARQHAAGAVKKSDQAL